MKGAIAAGHPLTAEAGARVLAEGGNAVDACVAAAFASWVAESPLTGPGAGGFMLVHRARDRSDRLLDFFVAAPGLGARVRAARRHGGDRHRLRRRHDAGLPDRRGVVRRARARRRASRRRTGPSARCRGRSLFEPALELARDGVELTPPQAYLHAILDLILRHTAEGRRIYGRRARLGPGDRLVLADLGDDARGARRARARPRSTAARSGRRSSRYLRAEGGAVTAADLAAYRVVRRRPVRAALPRPRVRLQPAALVGRRPDRLRAAPARRARPDGGAGQRRTRSRGSPR